MSVIVSQITGILFVSHAFFQAQIKENIKAPRHWHLWGELTDERRIPSKKGQKRGKFFHLMTSSWTMYIIPGMYFTNVNSRHSICHSISQISSQ